MQNLFLNGFPAVRTACRRPFPRKQKQYSEKTEKGKAVPAAAKETDKTVFCRSARMRPAQRQGLPRS